MTEFFVQSGRYRLPLLLRHEGGEGWGEVADFSALSNLVAEVAAPKANAPTPSPLQRGESASSASDTAPLLGGTGCGFIGTTNTQTEFHLLQTMLTKESNPQRRECSPAGASGILPTGQLR